MKVGKYPVDDDSFRRNIVKLDKFAAHQVGIFSSKNAEDPLRARTFWGGTMRHLIYEDRLKKLWFSNSKTRRLERG